MQSNPVCWFEIYVQDLGRAKLFYETVLGTELTELQMPEIEMLTFPMDMDGSGAAGALVKMDGFPSGGNSTLVYFACEDCATEASRVESAGGKIEKPKFSIGEYGFIALAVDTEGNMFGLHSQK
ncbi:VOC family protein [Rubripirellula reticaptiva]|uniref:Glyoxalase-like domain protein n=1 Tax=Rubripirellula reticaptiva TaxID=2528013 RepID=A0A5C6F410_9BACT|nr:VOC family protein [Rubripirellula reticaptiva]TWU55842.1 Glyoxalase-like domain protein [Rubripirellula reticaptiva]